MAQFVVVVRGCEDQPSAPMSFKEASVLARELAAKNKGAVQVRRVVGGAA